MTERVELEAGGRKFTAAAGIPRGGARHGAVIVVHEWHGLNDSVRSIVDRLAEEGFLAIAPDLYFGEVAKDDGRAAELMQAMKTEVSLDIFAACAASAKAHARGNGKVAIMGFCMGGAMAFAASTRVKGLAAAVPFYGLAMDEYMDPSAVGCPIQAHFARQDDWAKPERAEAFQKAATAAGKSVELFVYEAGHAFMREGDPARYDAASAKTAWGRATKFLHEHVD